VVKLRGLPFRANEVDVIEFFQGLDVVDVLLVRNGEDGKFNGDAFVVFGAAMQVRCIFLVAFDCRSYSDRLCRLAGCILHKGGSLHWLLFKARVSFPAGIHCISAFNMVAFKLGFSGLVAILGNCCSPAALAVPAYESRSFAVCWFCRQTN
jgi:hypothetical protein